jgi:hypothetical protein
MKHVFCLKFHVKEAALWQVSFPLFNPTPELVYSCMTSTQGKEMDDPLSEYPVVAHEIYHSQLLLIW